MTTTYKTQNTPEAIINVLEDIQRIQELLPSHERFGIISTPPSKTLSHVLQKLKHEKKIIKINQLLSIVFGYQLDVESLYYLSKEYGYLNSPSIERQLLDIRKKIVYLVSNQN